MYTFRAAGQAARNIEYDWRYLLYGDDNSDIRYDADQSTGTDSNAYTSFVSVCYGDWHDFWTDECGT